MGRNNGVRTMGDLIEAIESGEFYYEDNVTSSWKKGDKVPDGYKVVFGKLARVGGGKAAGGASSAHSSRSGGGGAGGGGGVHKNVSWQGIGLFGDEGKYSSKEDAKAAAKDINDMAKRWGKWAQKNKDRISTNKSGDNIYFDDDEDEKNLNAEVEDTLKYHQHTGATDTEVRDNVWKMIYGAMRKALP